MRYPVSSSSCLRVITFILSSAGAGGHGFITLKIRQSARGDDLTDDAHARRVSRRATAASDCLGWPASQPSDDGARGLVWAAPIGMRQQCAGALPSACARSAVGWLCNLSLAGTILLNNHSEAPAALHLSLLVSREFLR